MTHTVRHEDGTEVHVGDDWIVVRSSNKVHAESFAICDDCREAYLEPIYYSFGPEACQEGEEPHKECTGNLCPDCTGPYAEPDNEYDPRRPSE